jgi:glycogen debranching enzyme
MQNTTTDNWTYYWNLGLKTVKELETDQGIMASGKNELYGAIFGRDSLITSLKLLRVYQHTQIPDFLNTVRKVLLTLADLQGKEVNPESGEQPGKMIHEYRPDGHEHLTVLLPDPWYVYPDLVMRNYDTVDATSLFLITAYRYYQTSQDEDFLNRISPSIKSALLWIFDYGDSNGDGFIDYQIPLGRTYGGLINHNWMDSGDSVFHEDGSLVRYPVAPVEAQAYTYLALRLWGRHFAKRNEPILGEDASSAYRHLELRADKLKRDFNEKFLVKDDSVHVSYAIDGAGKQIRSIRSNAGHVLWASLNLIDDGVLDSILEDEYVEPVVHSLMMTDMFEPDAGIRTLSMLSSKFNPNSYHNGSIWPHDNSMIAEGFDNHGFLDEARSVRRAVLKAVSHFKTPIELYVYDKTYSDYLDHRGRTACKTQAWTAAALLTSVAKDYKPEELEVRPYKLVGFNLTHAMQMSVLTDKLQLKDKLKLGTRNLNEILKTVAQIRALNVIEKLRKQKVLPYAPSDIFNPKALMSENERTKIRKVFKTIRDKISL